MLDFGARPVIEAEWLAQHLSVDVVRIVDARGPGDGTSCELYQMGHIPGAIHLDWYHDLSWTYLPPTSIQTRVGGVGLEQSQRIIRYCGAGISASLGLFALHLAGYRNSALYDASWEEWGTDPTFPVERADE